MRIVFAIFILLFCPACQFGGSEEPTPPAPAVSACPKVSDIPEDDETLTEAEIVQVQQALQKACNLVPEEAESQCDPGQFSWERQQGVYLILPFECTPKAQVCPENVYTPVTLREEHVYFQANYTFTCEDS